MKLDATDKRIVAATQRGLPLSARPYNDLAATLELPVEEVLRRMRAMREAGIIRRVAAVPNHYALGYRANGMTVWDVDDDAVDRLGRQVGALDFVSHCYRRPRHLPVWPYNLFAMVHGPDRQVVERHTEEIAALLGRECREYGVLYSKRILKKTGLRLAG